MIRIHYLLILGLFLLSFGGKAQKQTIGKSKKLYVYWGYNRTLYGNSDIHLKGPGYDYTLKDVRAKDQPEEFTADVYLNPLKFTVPQFNFRVGYYLNEKYSISLGWDHLKYVLDNQQVGVIDGVITDDARDDFSKDNSFYTNGYVKRYNNEQILLDQEFIKYEHTDGLNFIRASIDRNDILFTSNKGTFELTLVSSFGIGPVLPWTDFTHLSGRRYTNRLHFSGFAFAYHSGLKLDFFNKFFVQSNIGAGYVYLPWVETKARKTDTASQQFGYGEWNFVAGFYINTKRIFKVNKERKGEKKLGSDKP